MRTLPDDTIVACDAGENRIMITHFYQTKRAGGFLQAAGAGADGVCHSGRADGFAMTMNGLMMGIEQDIPIITVVFNNRALGWVLHGDGPFAAEFADFDHAAIARAMGCHGVRVTEPGALAPALREALGARVPTVIDVRTSLAQSFADITLPLAVAASPRRR
jgi:acetolactate synthase-1/2/3 large subunit